MASENNPVIFTIDSAGNLNLNCMLNKYIDMHCNYSGKLADTFEYPYTIELTFNISSHSSISFCHQEDDWFDNNIETLNPKSQIGKFTFSDASTCSASFYTIYRYHQGKGDVYWQKKDFNFTKQ